MIQRLAIVGLGLMGGSLGLAARERAGVGRVVGFDPDPGALEAALTRGCVDEVAGELAAAVAGAELVALCAPVTELPAVLAELAALAPEATITDIGSTKAGVVAAVPRELRPRFIGGHPIAGMETRGAQNARAELFEGATWYLTPLAETEPARLRDLHRLLAVTSHLPHVLANLLVVQAGEARIDGHDPLTAIGGSFRDMTRVAGANPRIWVDIFLDNREALAGVLREHQRSLGEVLTALEAGDAGYLARWIGQSSGHRRRALEAQFDQRPEELYRVQVHVPDRPGVFAGITQALGAARINIEDFELHHFTPERGGTVELLVAGREAADAAVELLDAQGYGALAAPVLADAT